MDQSIKERLALLQKGDIPQGYRKTKAGIMPIDWDDTIRAKDVFRNYTDKKHNGELEILASTQENGIVPRSQIGIDIQCSDEGIAGYKKVSQGDFVISLRSFQGGIEYSQYEGIVSPAYTVLKPIKSISDGYYQNYFKTSGFIQRLNSAVYGIRDGKQISYQDFGNLYIHYPPVEEQKKIAQILAHCDKLIELKQKRIDSEKKYRQALLDELLYQPFLKRKWKLAFVEEVASVFGRIGFRGYTKADIVSAGQGALSLSPSNIEDNVLKTTTGTYVTWEKYYESPEIMIQADDILFVKTGSTYGKCARVNKVSCASTINPQLVIVRPQHINSIFLEKIFRSRIVQHRVEQIVVGGAVPTLTQEEIRKFVIPVPTLAEQVHISNVLDALDRTIELLEKERILWIIKKRALMQLLLTGTVRVKI